jgi:hypothetical protein
MFCLGQSKTRLPTSSPKSSQIKQALQGLQVLRGSTGFVLLVHVAELDAGLARRSDDSE